MQLLHQISYMESEVYAMRRKTPTRLKGVTLAEVMVVLIVIGILAMLVGPGVYSTIHSYRVRRGAREVLNMLQLARSQAALRNRAYRLRFGAQNQAMPTNQPLRCESDSADPARDGWILMDEGNTTSCTSFKDITATVQFDSRCISTFRYSPQLTDVAISALYKDGSAVSTASVCIKPDGRVLDAATGTPTRLNVCVVGVRSTSGSLATLPRQIAISYSGQAEITSGLCGGS